jgi:hypothetical protein
MNSNLIEEFVEKSVLNSMESLLDTSVEEEISKYSVDLASIFGADEQFKKIVGGEQEIEQKLISSFHNNLVLLIQKTWVEKNDEELKAEVLYHLDELCRQLNAHSYTASYEPFFSIVDDMVYLMFGNQSKQVDFDEYALRIDPEFGIFWWYMKSLPRDARWSEYKSRIVILLGMYFLANY